jgi:3'(2'), 5'-bisphosphate nucleotidase
MEERELLGLALEAAVKGAAEILKIYEMDFQVEFKEDKSPLTLADKNAHDAISAVLAVSDYPVLSEEGKHLPHEVRKTWQRFWLVDPLDGTKEFVKRNGEFTVNIALIEDGVPVLGVILVPVTGVLYYASMPEGAFRAAVSYDGQGNPKIIDPERLPAAGDLINRNYRVVCSRSHMSPETASFIDSIKPLHPDLEYVSIGSSLKLCLVAEGKADLYPRFGPTMEWDTAAGQAILEISGGSVLEATEKKPLRYNKADLLNPWFIATRK